MTRQCHYSRKLVARFGVCACSPDVLYTMSRLLRKLNNTAPVTSIFRIARSIVLPGFAGLSLFEVGRFFFQELQNNKLNERSAAVTYNFVMALPPTFLFFFSLIPYLPLGNVEDTIHQFINLVTPNSDLRNGLRSFVDDFLHKERRDLLSFGVLLTLYFSSNGMFGLMRSFDRSLPVLVKRSALRRRWTAIKLTLMLICVVVLSLATLIIQSNVVNDLLERIFHTIWAVKLVSVIVVLTIVFISVSLVYKYGPSLQERFRLFTPGSVFATLAIGIVTTVFFWLVNNFLNYNKVYGPIGSLIAFMVWMWLNTLIILLGYELNVSILLGKIARDTKKTANTDIH